MPNNFTSSIKDCIKHFVNALQYGNAAIFAGAGLSIESGFVNWKELMREIAEELGLDVDSETDLIAIAQFHVNERLGNRSKLNQLLIDNFTRNAKITKNHEILANLPISSYWTTNYDKMIERALDHVGKTPDVKIVSENIIINIPKRDAIIYKMHGDITLPHEAILTKDDYETYELNRSSYSIILQSELLSKTFLFLGFSFDDPNLVSILSRIKNIYGTSKIKTHYCFFKLEDDPIKLKKQELKMKDLNRYGIKAVIVSDYSQITNVLQEIDSYYKRSQIFISGAAETFLPFGSEEDSQSFIHDLTKSIVMNGFKIISGYGKNVGNSVINGVLDYVFTTKYRKLDEYLKLFPFPQNSSDKTSGYSDEELRVIKKERNNRYREMMLSESGIAIFMFGNKKDRNTANNIIESNGMFEEFEKAVEKGIIPIPIGATGYTAKKLHEKVMSNFSDYYDEDDVVLRQLLTEIGDNTLHHQILIQKVLTIIKRLNTI